MVDLTTERRRQALIRAGLRGPGLNDRTYLMVPLGAVRQDWLAPIAQAIREAADELGFHDFDKQGGIRVVFFRCPERDGASYNGFTVRALDGSDTFADVIFIGVDYTDFASVAHTIRHEVHHLWTEYRRGPRTGSAAAQYRQSVIDEADADAFAARRHTYWEDVHRQLGEGLGYVPGLTGDGIPLPVAAHRGKITVQNAAGTVVIDGTSNMFKIAASGTLNLTGCNGTAAQCLATTNVTLSTGLTATPAHLGFVQNAAGRATAMPLIGTNASLPGGVVDQLVNRSEVVQTNKTKMTFDWYSQDVNRSSLTYTFRYFVLKEAAF